MSFMDEMDNGNSKKRIVWYESVACEQHFRQSGKYALDIEA